MGNVFLITLDNVLVGMVQYFIILFICFLVFFLFHCFRCIETLRVCKQVNLFLRSIFFFFSVLVQDSRKWNKMKSFFLHNHIMPKRSFFLTVQYAGRILIWIYLRVFCFVLFCSFYEYFDIVFLMDISSVFTHVPMVI